MVYRSGSDIIGSVYCPAGKGVRQFSKPDFAPDVAVHPSIEVSIAKSATIECIARAKNDRRIQSGFSQVN
ncbi:hypothetical protein FD723_41145 (plasmid) [Nostoc sp. C052]|uniref:hypothetical protein n=1 Tax=Nostoc sp. C052 TaxID=2576902 RepID=UPI0015C2FBAE|nr:hypothetical protein [Nostoc sp. C052]QLE46616.1 hypothetical protein FD723_41145 [Nostoc sp. C052]